MNDGWDDDDDLDITLLDDNNADTNTDLKAAAGGGGGWEEDEELFGDDDDVNDNVGTAAVGGWGDDDLNFDDDDNNDSNQQHQAPEPPHGSSEPENNNTFGAGFQLPGGNDGGAAAAATRSGWEEDEELFDSDDGEGGEIEVIEKAPSPPPPSNDLLQQLEDYVSSLSRMQSSINALLDFEYNTPEKAQELLDYYSARPGLAEYTRTKEVPRMNYQVILPDGHVESDKQKIAQDHLPDHSLIARCANQSLLADLLQVLTGPDLVVRQQFLAICVAQMCQFRLHIGDEGRDMLQCNCMLQLSLPVEEGPRLNIATIRTTVAFSPKQHEPPMVKFQVDKIIVTLKESQYSKLQKVADFLTMMEGHLNELPGHEDLALQNAPADIFRDAFLEQSQQLLTQSKAGMKSALKEMESVIGLKSKFKAVRGGISKFLPDTNVLLAAEEEARALAAEREAQPQTQQRQPKPVPPPPPPPRQPILQAGRPPQSAPPLSNSARPTSILGGLVSTGWSALAKSVAIPEEDPAIYGNRSSSPTPQPMLYRKTEPAPAPKLYREPERPPASIPVSVPPSSSHYLPQEPIAAPPPLPPSHRHPNETQHHYPQSPVPPPRGLPSSMEDERLLATSVIPSDKAEAPKLEMPPSATDTADILGALDEQSPEQDFGDGWDDDLDITTDDVLTDDDVKEEQHESSKRETIHTDDVEKPTKQLPPDKASNIDIASSKTAVKAFTPPATIPPSSAKAQRKNPEPVPLPSLPPSKRSAPPRRSLLADIPYSIEDDIIPTRKRWVNPRPDRSYLLQ
jgi:hypothetical protein